VALFRRNNEAVTPEPATTTVDPGPAGKKDHPTPTRKEAEAAPEKMLMRDYIDSRFNLGEFLLPSVVVILAVTILGSYWPTVTVISTLAMYIFILGVFVDGYLMWRRFKKVLAARLPKASPKGLLLYGMTRSTQIRRFRSPPPRIKRGEAY
jgi:hypothetical protein